MVSSLSRPPSDKAAGNVESVRAGRGESNDKGCGQPNARNTTVPLVPPKPKELDNATRTRRSCVWCGT